MTEKKKRSLHPANERGAKSKKRAKRSTRKATSKKGNYKPGPGRPKGSKKDEWGLTPNQREIADAILDAELANGLWPSSTKELVEITGKDAKTIRALLKRKGFQDYLADQLKAEGVILEGSFWRSMALGLQAADPKVMQLYANMTGKITKQEERKVEVIVKGVVPEGEKSTAALEVGAPEISLPHYEDIEEAEVIDDD